MRDGQGVDNASADRVAKAESAPANWKGASERSFGAAALSRVEGDPEHAQAAFRHLRDNGEHLPLDVRLKPANLENSLKAPLAANTRPSLLLQTLMTASRSG